MALSQFSQNAALTPNGVQCVIFALHQAGQGVLTAAHSTQSLWKQFAADESGVASPIEQIVAWAGRRCEFCP